MLEPRKRLGQNFLRDANIANKIVASLRAEEDEHVLEIGPGEGALTELLAPRFSQLSLVEPDKRAVEWLKSRFPDTVIHHADVLKMDPAELTGGQPTSVVGNIPYYITSPILFMLLDNRSAFREAVLMLQREVAERLVASRGGKIYGILSVQAQLLSRPRMLFHVSRNVFYPRPRVDSAVVHLDLDVESLPVEPQQLKRVVRMAFNQRRKKLRNTLKSLVADKSGEPPVDLELRAEQLNPEDFVSLVRWIHEQ